MPEPIRVLVVGPAPAGPTSRGGMATVTTLMLAQSDPRVTLRHVTTYVDAGRWMRLVVGVGGMLRSSVLLLRGRADVLHVHLAHGGSVLRKAAPVLAARLRHVPVIVHAHSYDFAGWFDSLPRVGRRLVVAVLGPGRWLVLGDAPAGEYGARLPGRDVRVLRNPVRRPAALPARADVPVRIVGLGRLGERKGSLDLVRAVSRLPVTPPFHVTLAGDGDVEAVRQAVLDAGLIDLVTVRSWVSPTDRDGLLAGAQVFVLPSHDEGLPMALLEAMAWGLAPVTTPVGAIPDAVDDGVEGLLVPVGDVAALAAALQRLIVDVPLRHRLAAAARLRSADYDVTAWFDDLVAHWQDLAPHR